LVECKLTKKNEAGAIVGGIYFNAWQTGDVNFTYTVKQDDPSGIWSIEYCGVWSDFVANQGWQLITP
jgi:hypothetical protein